MKKVFHLKFNKESDGDWYIEFPGYPFAHHNLMMVAGANQLCAYVAEAQGHPDRAIVDVTLGDNLLDGMMPDIVMDRFKKGYGASYRNSVPQTGEPPLVWWNGRDVEVTEAWLCPVTLLVLFQYPRRINIYICED